MRSSLLSEISQHMQPVKHGGHLTHSASPISDHPTYSYSLTSQDHHRSDACLLLIQPLLKYSIFLSVRLGLNRFKTNIKNSHFNQSHYSHKHTILLKYLTCLVFILVLNPLPLGELI